MLTHSGSGSSAAGVVSFGADAVLFSAVVVDCPASSFIRSETSESASVLSPLAASKGCTCGTVAPTGEDNGIRA